MIDPYTELAESILLWDWASRRGRRADQVAAEQRLKTIAELLKEAGWKIGNENKTR